MFFWLANSVFLILLLIFSGQSWGQPKSPPAPAIESFEKKEKFLKDPIEQPVPDTRETPLLENKKEPRLGSEAKDIQKQKSKIKKKVGDEDLKADLRRKSRIGDDPMDLSIKAEQPLYDINSGNSLENSQQSIGKDDSMELVPDILAKNKADAEYDDDEADEVREKIEKILKTYKTIENIPLSVLNADSDIKESLEKYLDDKKEKGSLSAYFDK